MILREAFFFFSGMATKKGGGVKGLITKKALFKLF